MIRHAKLSKRKVFSALAAFVLSGAMACSFMPSVLNTFAATGDPGHYDADFASLEEAHEFADKVNIELMSESMVLMKNANVDGKPALPLSTEKDGITLMGAPSYHVVAGGMGSGAGGAIEVTLQDSFRDAGFRVNNIMEETYNNLPESVYQGAVSAGVRGYKISTIQEDPEAIKSAEYSIADNGTKYQTVIWTLSRVGCEGSDGFTSDIPINKDPTKHYLELNDGEEKMLNYLTELKKAGKVEKVIVLIGSANVMELGPLEDSDTVDGIFWLGQPGSNGLAAVGKVMSGEVNPSGKTVDVWNANHKADPTWNNFGNNSQHDSWQYDAATDEWKKVGTALDNYAYVGDEADTATHTVEYEEGIYLGYKWYETAWYEDALSQLPTYDSTYNNAADENGYYNRGNGVVYPFGYGLSYTTFEQTFVTGADELAAAINAKASDGKANLDETVEVKVKVTNTGDVAGKDVVQLYVNAPYTTGGIEKAYVQLVSFAKTDELQPDESQTVSLRVRLADIAAFDYNDANKNDYKGYEIEHGTYNFRIQKNSHELCDGETNTLSASLDQIWLDNDADASNNTPYSNGDDFDTLLIQKREDSNATMTLLSRADLVGTFPTVPEAEDRDYGRYIANLLHQGGNANTAGLNYGENEYRRYMENMNSSDDLTTDPWYKTNEQIPDDWTQATEDEAEKRENGKTEVQIFEMSGLDYQDDETLLKEGDPFYDPAKQYTQADAWVMFMNQLTYDEMAQLISDNSFSTAGLPAVGLNEVKDADGPAQLGKSEGGYTWCCEVNIASTWNVELAYARGYMTGHDSLFLDITGWYGPSMNMHHSPFGGRNFEYYSQDALQGGFIAAADVAGFKSMGGISYIKHFVLNDTESDRAGLGTWLSEQAARENYFKNFEYAIKEFDEDIDITIDGFNITSDKIGGSMGIMTGGNRTGAIGGYINYRNQQTLARDEWGFKGKIVTDMYGGGFGKGNMLIRSGGSIPLGTYSGYNVITGEWDDSLRGGKGGVRDGLPVYTASTADAEGAVAVTESNLEAVNRYLPDAKVGDYVLEGAVPESATQYYAVRKAAMTVLYAGANSNTLKNGLDENLFANKEYTICVGNMLDVNFASEMDIGSTISYSALSELPEGVELTAAGELTGRPTTVGTYKIKVMMKTQQWITAEAEVTLTVTPLLSTDSDLKAETGKAFSATFTQDIFHLNDMFDDSYLAFKDEVGRITDISYSLETPVPGLSLSKDGVLSGTPTEAGSYEIVVRTTVGYPSDRGKAMKADFDTVFTLEVAGETAQQPGEQPEQEEQFQIREENGVVQISFDYGQTWKDIIDKTELQPETPPAENGGGCSGSVTGITMAVALAAVSAAGAVFIARKHRSEK